jgi:DNA-binding LacI/PurR family transcriptional regulator
MGYGVRMTPTPASERLTVRDIAAATGVSISTVSRVLNGRPDVATRTRDIVLDHVRDTPGRTAVTVRRTSLISVVVPELKGGYSATIVEGIAEALAEQDRRMLLISTGHQREIEHGIIKKLVEDGTDGAILVLPSASRSHLKNLQVQNYPFVIVDPRHELPPGTPSVRASNGAGGIAATEHLVTLGHKRIGLISGPPDWIASTGRIMGFRAALSAGRLDLDESLIVVSDGHLELGRIAARELLSRPDRPTAIVAFNDLTAIAVMQVARELNLRVPEDISVVGFDDSEIAALASPPLTTVRQPLAELGRMGAILLDRVISGQSRETPSIDLQTQLLIRGTTAPPAPRYG